MKTTKAAEETPGLPLPIAGRRRPPTLAKERAAAKKSPSKAKKKKVRVRPRAGPGGKSSASKTRKQLTPRSLSGLAVAINGRHKLVQSTFRESVTHADQAGQFLELAQREVRKTQGHGHWLAWLAANCPDVSGRTARLYMRVAKHIKALGGDSAAVAKMAGKSLKTLDKVFGADQSAEAKKARRDEKEAALAEATAAASERLGRRLYNLFYVDCPWRYEPWSRKTGMDRAADNHYPTMTVAALLEMQAQVDAVTAKAAGMCLWATVPMLVEALKVMTTWGFAYKSHLIWKKPHIITGHWNRNVHELLLIGTRGDFPAPAPGTQPQSVIEADIPGPREHSRKPAEFRELLDRWYPNVAKLELFAREDRHEETRIPEGWDVWGNEAPEQSEDAA